MGKIGPEGPPYVDLEKDIEFCAWAKALGLVPVVLHDHQKYEQEAQIAHKFNTLDRNSLMGRVTARTDEVRQFLAQNGGIPASFQDALELFEEKFTPNVPEPKPGKTQTKVKTEKEENPSKPKQMYLGDVHPEGSVGFWGEAETQLGPGITYKDPEESIHRMHYKKRIFITHPIMKDIEHEHIEFLKRIGYTDKEIKAKLVLKYEEAVLRIQDAGLWYLIEKQGLLSDDERLLLRAALEIKVDPYRDV